MLIEIFNNEIFSELCVNSPDEIPKKVPKTTITECDRTTIDQYTKVRDFLINALDNPSYLLKNHGYYMLVIEKKIKSASDKVWLTAQVSSDFFNEEFKFKFDVINGDPEWRTIHGNVIINYLNEVVGYTRENFSGPKINENNTTFRKELVTDSTSTSGKRVEYVEAPTRFPGEDSACNSSSINSTANPIDLSPDSFSVERGVIGVTCPEMGIGVVESNTLKIDEKRQAAQDAFMRTISRKMSKAVKKHKETRT